MEDIGSLVVKVAMDNSNFQQGIQNLNRSMRVIQSEFKNATSGLKDHGQGLDGLKAKQEMLSKSIDVQSKIVQQYKDKLKESKETLNKNAEAQEKLKTKVENAKNAYEQSKQVLGENNTKTKELKKAYEDLSTEYTDNEDKLRNNVRTIDKYSTKLNNAEAKLKGMQQQLNTVNSSIEQNSNKWNQLSQKLDSVGKKFDAVGKKMSSIGKRLTAKLTTPIAAIGGIASKVGMDFEASMSNVSALSGATGNDLKQLENKARDAGASTSKSAKDAADALGYMALAGYDNKQMMEALMPVLRLSEAGNLDLARTSDLVTDSLSALGKSTKDLPVYLDQVAKTAASSNTNIDALMEALIVCGGTVKNLNMPLDEANTHLGVLANRGIKGSEAGNSFNSILINLTSGAGQAGKAMEQLGLSAFDSEGKFKGVTQVLLELKEKTKNMSEEQRNMYLSMIGGKTQITTLQALLAGVGEEYGDLKGKIQDSNGALNDMAKTMQDNNKGSITELKSASEELGIKIYDVLKPKIASITQTFKKWTNALNSLSPEQQKLIVDIGLLSASIGPLIWTGGKLFTSISKISKGFSAVSKALAVAKGTATATTPAVNLLAKAFTLLNWKVALVVGAIAGIAYVGKKVYKHFSQASIQQEKFGNDISQSTKKALGSYEKLDKKVGQSLMSMRVKNSKVTKGMAKDLTSSFDKMGNDIVQGINKKFDKSYKTMEKHLSKTQAISSERKQEILNDVKKKQQFEVNTVQQGQKKITEIIQKASDENRKITEEEWHVINNTRDNMNKDAIRFLTKNQREQKVLLERQKRNAETITAEQAGNVVKNSAKQRDAVVKEAEKQCDETIANIIYQRDELGIISSEEANKLIDDAEYQKEMVVNKAQGMHEEVVMEAEKQAGEHADKVDWETGEIKSKWQVMVDNVSAKAHEMKENASKAIEEKSKAISDKMAEIKTNINNKWNEILNYFATLPSKLRAKGSEMFEAMRSGIASKLASIKAKCNEIGNSIVNSFKSVPSKLRSIGHNIMDGLKNGLTSKVGEVMSKAGEIAQGIANKMKEKLDIHSPSRVTYAIGKFVDEGLAGGMLDNADMVSEASKKIADTVTKEIEYIKNKLNKDTKDLNNKLYNLQQAENKASRNAKGKQKYAIKDQYEAKKKAIKDQIKLRKEQADKEIKELQRIGKEAKEQLDKEIKIKKNAIDTIDKLNDYIIKALNRKIGKEKEVAIEQAKIKAKESNLTKDQLDSLLKYTNEYYEKKLDKDRLQAVSEQLIASKNQKAIIELLNKYGEIYEDTGTTLGKKLVLGTKKWTDIIPPMMDETMKNVQATVQYSAKNIEKTLSTLMADMQKVGVAGAELGIFSNEIFSKWQKELEESNKKEDVMQRITDKYKEAFRDLEFSNINLGRQTKNANEELNRQQNIIDNQTTKLEILKEQYTEMAETFGENDEEVIQLRKDIAELTIEIENNSLQLNTDRVENRYKKAFDEIEIAFIKLGKTTKDFKGEFEKQTKEVEQQTKKLELLNKQYEELKQILGEDAEAVIQLRKEILNLQIEIENNIENNKNSMANHINEFTDKVKDALRQRYEKEQELQEANLNKELEHLDKWKDESIKRIEDIYNAKIKALDDQLKAEDKMEKDREELKKINQLKEAIAFEHNEFNKVELQKELARVVEERNKRLHKEEIEEKKLQLEQDKQNEINSINNLYEANKNNLDNQLNNVKEFYKEKLKTANLEAEAEVLIVFNQQEEIVSLLKNYGKDYEEAGKTLGQRFYEGFEDKVKDMQKIIENITSKINNLRTKEIEDSINDMRYNPISSDFVIGSNSNTTNNNSSKVVNNNNITFNSPKALSPSEQRRETETTLRNLAFSV